MNAYGLSMKCVIIVLGFTAICATELTHAAAADRPPNVILIMADVRESRPYSPSNDTAESGVARRLLQAAFNQLKVNPELLDTRATTEDHQ